MLNTLALAILTLALGAQAHDNGMDMSMFVIPSSYAITPR